MMRCYDSYHSCDKEFLVKIAPRRKSFLWDRCYPIDQKRMFAEDLLVNGIWKLVQTYTKRDRRRKISTGLSVGLSIISVLYLVLAREAYAAAVSILLMLIKGLIMFGSRENTATN